MTRPATAFQVAAVHGSIPFTDNCSRFRFSETHATLGAKPLWRVLVGILLEETAARNLCSVNLGLASSWGQQAQLPTQLSVLLLQGASDGPVVRNLNGSRKVPLKLQGELYNVKAMAAFYRGVGL